MQQKNKVAAVKPPTQTHGASPEGEIHVFF